MAFRDGLEVQAEFRAAQTANEVIQGGYVYLLSTRLHFMLWALISGDGNPTPFASSHFRPAPKRHFAIGRTLGNILPECCLPIFKSAGKNLKLFLLGAKEEEIKCR
jgi:hypothetical protein